MSGHPVDIDAADADILWSVHRRPHRSMLIWTASLSFLFVIGSIALIPLLTENTPLWYIIGSAIGSALGLALMASVWRGSSCSIDAVGVCRLRFSPKTNVSFNIKDVVNLAYVNNGMLRGIAVDIKIADIRIHHNKGINSATLRRQQARMGCPLVLEFLLAEDLQMMQDLRQRLHDAC